MAKALLQRFWERYVWSEERSLENPAIPLNQKTLIEYLGGNKTNSGQSVNEKSAMGLTAMWRAIDLVSSSLASMPYSVFRPTETGKEKQPNHYASNLLQRRPNSYSTPFMFRKAMVVNAMLFGNGYAVIERSSASGLPQSLKFLFGNQVEVKLRDGKKVYEVTGSPLNDTSNEVYFDYEIIHLPGLTADGICGLDVLKVQSESIGYTLALQMFAATFFGNGASVKYALMHPATLSSDAQERLRSGFDSKYSGTGAHRSMVLEEGMKLQAVGSNPDEAQLIESRKFGIEEISRITGVAPPLLFQLGGSSYNSLEQLSLEFVKYTLMPWAVRFEQETDWKLFTERDKAAGYYGKLNMNSLLRGDLATRKDFYEGMLRYGVLTIDEVRAMEDMNPLPDGLGKYNFVQINMQTLENAIATQPDGTPIPIDNQ